MTDLVDERTPPPVAAADELPVYSKDYWDLVFEQLQRRALFKVGLAVLALLYASAIYAPLIANDRPYTLESIDVSGYQAAIRGLRGPTNRIIELTTMTQEAYLAELEASGMVGDDAAEQTPAEALIVEREAVQLRIDTIRAHLPDGQAQPIIDFAAQLDEALALHEAGDAEGAAAAFGLAKDLTSSRGPLRKELGKIYDPEQPEAGGVKLIGTRSHPLWESISAWEIFFFVFWALLMLWPVWNRLLNRVVLGGDRAHIRRWRWRKTFAVLGLSGACALAWSAAGIEDAGAYDVAPFKKGLTDGGILLVKAGMSADQPDSASEPTWPLVRFGYADTRLEEINRPPTWLANAELDEEGRYVRGSRAQGDRTGETGPVAASSPVKVLVGEPARNSGWRRLAGTDESGRDFFTRMLWGGRVSLAVGILSAFLLTVIGVIIGSLAGYFGGWIDIAIMRVIEVLQAIPAFFLILLTMAFTDPKVVPPIIAIVVVIALIRWTGVARLVRGEFLRLREQEFVLAARALGFSSRRTMFRHVLPNAMSPVLVSAAFAVAAGILTESAVSFLGFGISEPAASWGALVNETKNSDYWWVQVFPGLLIFLTVTCYNLVGDAVRDALDPKMKV